jgi:hypothetical protein
MCHVLSGGDAAMEKVVFLSIVLTCGLFCQLIGQSGPLCQKFDATSRKNYSHFGDVVSFDSTYTTNQYNMIFAPFTGVNHHLQSVFFGAAFLANEKNESYIWLFQTFLKAMGGVAPRLIITDEAGSIKIAIDKGFSRYRAHVLHVAYNG